MTPYRTMPSAPLTCPTCKGSGWWQTEDGHDRRCFCRVGRAHLDEVLDSIERALGEMEARR